MPDHDRRSGYDRPSRAMERELNDTQLITLRELENYGWELKFMRREPFQKPKPVLLDGERKHFAVLKEDGTLDETPGFDIRH